MASKFLDIDPGSYKDPAGQVFHYDKKVFRFVNSKESPLLSKFINSAVFIDLVKNGDIVDTRISDLGHNKEIAAQFGEGIIFEHQKIEFISYPYEWSFSMCLDAAVLTLSLQRTLLENDLSLKDATPYNIQFVNSKPIFIDICSIESISYNAVWIAYSQFCQMFLYPLLLYVYRGINPKNIYLANIEGVTLEDTYKIIGLKAKLNTRLFTNLVLPKLLATIFKKIQLIDEKASTLTANLKNNKQVQVSIIRRLERLLKSLMDNKYSSHWSTYENTNSYNDTSEKIKMEFIESVFKKNNIKTVLDLGCNTGVYSKIAASYGTDVIAVDSDLDCIDKLYRQAHDNREHILPLCIDLSNPSPSIGWDNKERKSFLKRVQFDCVFSLALIHHLMITGRHPLSQIVTTMSKMTKKYLIVEYIGPTDEMFKLLMLNRKENYNNYNLEYFRNKYLSSFNILAELPIANMDRVLFLMEKKATKQC